MNPTGAPKSSRPAVGPQHPRDLPVSMVLRFQQTIGNRATLRALGIGAAKRPDGTEPAPANPDTPVPTTRPFAKRRILTLAILLAVAIIAAWIYWFWR